MKRIILLLATLALLISISINVFATPDYLEIKGDFKVFCQSDSWEVTIGKLDYANDLIEGMRAYEKYSTGLLMSPVDAFNNGYFTGYIMGCVGTLPHDGYYTLPDNVTVGQLCAIFTKYMNNHPEYWNLPASLLVYFALIDAFPKR